MGRIKEAESIVKGLDFDEFLRDRRSRLALRYSIVLMVEALGDLAVAVLEKDFNATPRSYREAFTLLAEKGVVTAELASRMERLAPLRNMIVHSYTG
jgi:uncharacterized protein YutE (UPF0331/DUF86 family)